MLEAAPMLSAKRLALFICFSVGLAGCAMSGSVRPAAAPGSLAHAFSEGNLRRFTDRMDPAVRALAVRHMPGRRADLWGRPPGWGSLDLKSPPALLAAAPLGEDAQALNALRPISSLPLRPMRPFVLKAATADAERALTCLTQAVYYESAREPALGQEAVAQVVLNRLRHPAYPKSVCGVVYQGAARATGCQFTFTCDGSLARTPDPVAWVRARDVAWRALNGFVARNVGSATHYHAEYVAPSWAPTLVKLGQIGQHIFYRWTGPWGEPPAFTGRYAGGEALLTPALLEAVDARTQGAEPLVRARAPVAVTLTVAGEQRTYRMADARLPLDERPPLAGVLQPGRRKPTPEEVREINLRLSALEGATAAN